MLFHSFFFLFVFLPIVVAGYFLCGRFLPARAPKLWLGAASLVFYAHWNPALLWVLVVTIGFNLAASHVLARAGTPARRRLTLAISIGINLAFLAWFKCAGLFTHVGFSEGLTEGITTLALPLGISFFTFEAISYLVDSYRHNERPARAADYLLYVAFFPHLISGPIVRFRQLMAQFAAPDFMRPQVGNIAAGLTLLSFGLAKKCLIADNAAVIANEAFRLAEMAKRFTVFDAWLGALGYTVQIYFDFSGYSDMACGLALLLNIRLPVNFLSPYRARSIADFWRRWHITLSTFLRDYLYIPLGGNRAGPLRRNVNILITMLLGGLWHGVGWTFLIWGGLHALYLIICHTWRGWQQRLGFALPPVFGWALTFLAVVVAWVFFRSPNLPTATSFLATMFNPKTWPLPQEVQPWLGFLGDSVRFGSPVLRGNYPTGLIALTFGALGLALFAPNTMQLLRAMRPADSEIPPSRCEIPASWVVSAPAALAAGLLFLATLWWRPAKIEFLYFQF